MFSSAFGTVTPRARALVSFKSRHLPFQSRFNSGSSVHEGNPTTLEIEKQRNLERKQHLTSTTHEVHAPGWNEYLASASEAHVKADKFGEEGPPTSELASKTVKHILERHGGTEHSTEEATYERDEVQGPLKGSAAGTVNESHIKEAHTRKSTNNMTVSEEDKIR